MASTHTERFHLIKQDGDDHISLFDLNDNFDKIDDEMNKSRPLILSVASVSALPYTIANINITATMKCSKLVLSNPVARKSAWNITTSDGTVVISGTINGTTNIELWLVEPLA